MFDVAAVARVQRSGTRDLKTTLKLRTQLNNFESRVCFATPGLRGRSKHDPN